MQAHGGVEVEIHPFLTLAQDEGAGNFMLWPLYLSGIVYEVLLDKSLGG